MTEKTFECKSDKTTKNKKRFQILDDMGNSLGSIYLPKATEKCTVVINFE